MADGKWIEALTPEMPVAEAARLIFAARFEVVRTALPAAVERYAEDIEHVHQLRVGTRRAGAALKLLGDCLPDKFRKRAKRSLRTIRRAAGGARDWDVFLHNLAHAKPLTTSAGKPTLDFLRGYALNERASAQRHLAGAAQEAGPDFEQLCEQLADVVEAVDEAETFDVRAKAQMGELLRAFTAAVEANPTEPAEMHQLRILAKRVRYAMELFVDCLPASFREELYPAIEEVQEILGSLQDAVVGVARLESLRTSVQAIMPGEWPRLRSGVNGLMTTLRRRIPTHRKQFQTWRTAWAARDLSLSKA